MDEPFEELYFNWLCAKVVDVRETNPNLLYWELLKVLQTTEFVWLLSGDDNRAEDGKELRREFLIAADLPDNQDWRYILGCSLLEMFIAFSRRTEFDSGVKARLWFWEFMDNLGLKEFNDANFDPHKVDDILQEFIWRTYDDHGHGGMFPMKSPLSGDQRKVEIWYQFCDYLVDQDRLP
jgi:hypothetical protein